MKGCVEKYLDLDLQVFLGFHACDLTDCNFYEHVYNTK